MNRPSIVVIGGGTGNFNVLTGLKRYPVDLTAIVAMSDSGGSSGRLRDEMGMLPPGDVRQCLVALAEDVEQREIIRSLFNHRFNNGLGLEGHNVGNLLIAALSDITGGYERAIEAAARLLNVRGRVLPVTLTDTHLHAVLSNGEELAGEAVIDGRDAQPGVEIERVSLVPEAEPSEDALDAISSADLLVLAPGDLYTSLIPNLLVPGVAEAIRESNARLAYVVNLMTKPGETDGFTADRFVRTVGQYLGGEGRIDDLIVNSRPFAPTVLSRYEREGAYAVRYDMDRLRRLVSNVIACDVVAEGRYVRHEPAKLACAVMSVLRERSNGRGSLQPAMSEAAEARMSAD